MLQRIATFGIKTTLVETRDFAALVSGLADSPNQSVFFCNVHMLMLGQDDKVLANAMDNADIVFADGVPIAWLQSQLTDKDAKVVRGYEIMLTVCEKAAKNGEKVGFYGSTPEVIKSLIDNLCIQFDDLKIAYQMCPPFEEGEVVSPVEDLQAINESEITWLFVGLGCPKQEKWIDKYNSELRCNVLGVGAAFDWLSGLTNKPPKWMEKYALAWIYRLFQDPAGMWHRYMKYNTKFMLKFFKLKFVGK